MAEYELDPRPFFNILHSLLRHDELDYDREAIGACASWVATHATTLRKVCSPAEFGVLMPYYAFWDKHKEAPNRDGMKPLILARQQPEGPLALLEQYDKHEDDLTVLNPIELHAQLDLRIDDYNKRKLSRVLDIAGHIVVGSQTIEDKVRKTKIVYEGPAGALSYLHQREQEGLLIGDAPAQGGALADTADKIVARYAKTEADLRNNNLFIPTGIPLIDNQLGGLRRKEVNGVLASTGQRKTGMSRHIAYSAATVGFRVLYIPLESDYDEEENAQLGLHASYFVRGPHGITKKAIERGMLSAEDKKLLPEVAESWKQSVAKNLIVWSPASRTWPDVRSIIERETAEEPIDLVVIDYLTLLSTPGSRDDIADKIAIIQDVKRLAMTANNGRGLSILTPVQGNRNGYADAAENDGVWSTSGIFKYSELEKSLDNCFYIYFNDGMNLESRMKIGTCKTRRDQLIPATFVSVDPESGRIRPITDRDVAPSANKRPGPLSQQLADAMHLLRKDVVDEEAV